MELASIIASRIKLLEFQYHISLKNLADMLDISPNTLSKWQTGKRYPVTDNLVEMADFFAVNLDWLTGRDTQKYSIHIIEKLEEKLLSDAVKIRGDAPEMLLWDELPDEYKDLASRRECYPDIEVRANIVVLYHQRSGLINAHLKNLIKDGLIETDDFAAQQKEYGSHMFDYLRKKNLTDDFQRLIWRKVDRPIYTIPY